MNDTFTRLQFLILGSNAPEISTNEYRRIRGTLSLVPSDWKSVLDVGCGDGRVGNALIHKDRRIIGADWSTASLTHCQFDRFVCDIRSEWPVSGRFDGAICAEVLEHLPQSQITRVLNNIRAHSRYGFIVTVPARELIEAHMIRCPHCHSPFHAWGHLHRFNSFEEVDDLVNARSVQRVFIPCRGEKPARWTTRLKNAFGYQMVAKDSICPFCGTRSPDVPRYSWLHKLLFNGLAAMERLTGPFRPQIGWFACRYEVDP